MNRRRSIDPANQAVRMAATIDQSTIEGIGRNVSAIRLTTKPFTSPHSDQYNAADAAAVLKSFFTSARIVQGGVKRFPAKWSVHSQAMILP